ncbi:MAG: branched-chain amino acid ABC transporter substrate-binding protein, partial [Acetobacteraceae bacterium]|nr:branched-chain amino acid ABC transporter substrate-binding protein [Acetobacteraceae bacterium]
MLASLAATSLLALSGPRSNAETAVIAVGYLRWMERRPAISLLDQQPADDGLAGAQLAADDNNTTGQFLGQSYTLIDKPIRAEDDPVAAL